ITFVTARADDGTLLGCGALTQHDATLGELKSMRTTAAARGRGVGAAVLGHLLDVARDRGLARVSLEPGAEEYFAPARRRYARHGCAPCAPFADYTHGPLCVYLTLALWRGTQGWWSWRPRASTGGAPGRVHRGAGRVVSLHPATPSASVRQNQPG